MCAVGIALIARQIQVNERVVVFNHTHLHESAATLMCVCLSIEAVHTVVMTHSGDRPVRRLTPLSSSLIFSLLHTHAHTHTRTHTIIITINQ